MEKKLIPLKINTMSNNDDIQHNEVNFATEEVTQATRRTKRKRAYSLVQTESCDETEENEYQDKKICCICKKETNEKTKCYIVQCRKEYHEECLKSWPHVIWSSNKSLQCPQHYCFTCESIRPGVLKPRKGTSTLVRCVNCPISYHQGKFCLPVGCKILSKNEIICPRHHECSFREHTQWCIECGNDGHLLNCAECPRSFHQECAGGLTSDEFKCGYCRNGRFLLQGEAAWVIFSNSWWPVQVINPQDVPANLLPKQSEFVVKFVQSGKHMVVTIRQAFLYENEDSMQMMLLNELDLVYNVNEQYKRRKTFMLSKEQANTNETKKTSSGGKLLKTYKQSRSSKRPLNRKKNDPTKFQTSERLYEVNGNIVTTLTAIKKNQLISKYHGDVINNIEYKKRWKDLSKNNEQNNQFISLEKNEILDSRPHGIITQFINYSMNPNCESRKWVNGGKTHAGLFALKDIAAGKLLYQRFPQAKVKLEQCKENYSSTNLPIKGKPEAVERFLRKRLEKITCDVEKTCFKCDKTGILLYCDNTKCRLGFHVECLSNLRWPIRRWLCPRHYCCICHVKATVKKCKLCSNSFCHTHIQNKLKVTAENDYICIEH